MADMDYGEPVKIGYSGLEDWRAMHRANQSTLMFYVIFEKLNSPSALRDYRPILANVWSHFLRETGLSAMIVHQSWHPDRGPASKLMGFVWRQFKAEHLASMSEDEILETVELLRKPTSGVTAFVVNEHRTGEKFGVYQKQRRFKLRKNGAYTVESFRTE